MQDKLGNKPIKHYYDNGNLSVEGNYSNGLRDGLWKFYNENGSIFSEYYYIKGAPIGFIKTYPINPIFTRTIFYAR